MQITYNLPHVFFQGASQVENAQVLRILLDALIDLNLAYLKNHAAPSLYQSGVVYGRTQIWEPIPALYSRGYGDCKSLSAALIAEYRRKGIECQPVFRWIKNPKNTGTNYHILVQTAKGFEDPSKVLGMGRNENAHFHR
jgi:hypothetical protein